MKTGQLAATSRNRDLNTACLPCQYFLPKLRYFIQSERQFKWDLEVENKLHMVKPLFGKWHSSSQNIHRLEVPLCRLRIGHTCLTHRFLRCDDDSHGREHCRANLSDLRVFYVCPLQDIFRRKHFSQLFRNCIPFHPAPLNITSYSVGVSIL